MATRQIDRGPISEHVSENLASLRNKRHLTLAELSQRLEDLGRPILPTGLSKIEKGTRRIDVDDLVALAVALDVSPNLLLLPPRAEQDDTQVSLTPRRATLWRRAWAWAAGEISLDRPASATTITRGPDKPPPSNLDFEVENRPHDPPVTVTLEQITERGQQLAGLTREWFAALDRGESPRWLISYLQVQSAFNGRPAARGFSWGLSMSLDLSEVDHG